MFDFGAARPPVTRPSFSDVSVIFMLRLSAFIGCVKKLSIPLAFFMPNNL
jgi:hypothetical protein